MSLSWQDLNAHQRRNVRAVVREGQRSKQPRKRIKAAIATILVEKNAVHTAGGDRDSNGAFQQRPSQGWGSAGETITRDARQFYAAAKRMDRDDLSAGQLAADVQRPAAAYRGRYGARGGDAEKLLSHFGLGENGSRGGVRGGARAGASSAPTSLKVDLPDAAEPIVREQDTKLDKLGEVQALLGGKQDILGFASNIRAIDAAAAPRTIQAGVSEDVRDQFGKPIEVPGSASAPRPGRSRDPGRSGGGAETALSWATSKVGEKEQGSNRGKLPDYLNQRFGFGASGGQPWCAMFTSAAVTKGGAPKSARSASVAEIRAKAGRGDGYQRGVRSGKQAKKGDLILFGNAHMGMVESVRNGKIHYVAGNQSDSVARGTTSASGAEVVRPKYGAKKR